MHECRINKDIQYTWLISLTHRGDHERVIKGAFARLYRCGSRLVAHQFGPMNVPETSCRFILKFLKWSDDLGFVQQLNLSLGIESLEDMPHVPFKLEGAAKQWKQCRSQDFLQLWPGLKKMNLVVGKFRWGEQGRPKTRTPTASL